MLVAALLAYGLLSPAMAEDSTTLVPANPAQMRLSFAPVVKRVTPAVVNVYAQHIEQQRNNPLFDDPFFQQFFGGGGASDRVQRSLGSGVIVDPSGLIVTNYHVIDQATEIKIALSDKREFTAEVVLKDQRADLAVLRIKNGKEVFPTLSIADSDTVQVGDLVLAVGDPFGVGQTVTCGIVSALARSQVGRSDYQSFIQTDAAINPGNSGGALVDLDGKLVGINTAIVSRSGGNIGIGFAIPSSMVKVVINSAKSGADHVIRPWLGASLQALTPEIAESLSLPRPTGALIADVAKDGPSEKAGLHSGDVILSVDGHQVSDPDEFGYRFATTPIGGTTRLDVLRGGKTVSISMPLTAPQETVAADEATIGGSSPLAGITVVNLSPSVADELGVAIDQKGVIVKGVAPDTAADSFGFQRNDILVALNGQPITSTKDVSAASAHARAMWRVTINRGGRQITSILSQ